MICRTPTLTAKNLQDMQVMIRLRWVALMHERLLQGLKDPGKTVVGLVSDLTDATDIFKPIQDPLVLWGFQLLISKAESIRTIMKPELYQEYLDMARTSQPVFNQNQLSSDMQKNLEDFEVGRLDIIRILEDAPALDPELIQAQIPNTPTPPGLN